MWKNLKEFIRGKNDSPKVYLEINVARFARKNDTFLASFQTLCDNQIKHSELIFRIFQSWWNNTLIDFSSRQKQQIITVGRHPTNKSEK